MYIYIYIYTSMKLHRPIYLKVVLHCTVVTEKWLRKTYSECATWPITANMIIQRIHCMELIWQMTICWIIFIGIWLVRRRSSIHYDFMAKLSDISNSLWELLMIVLSIFLSHITNIYIYGYLVQYNFH